MAGNIKGITIEIGGDTQPLQNALKGVLKPPKNCVRLTRLLSLILAMSLF